MKKSFLNSLTMLLAIVVASVMLAACGPMPTATFNDKAAIGEKSVQLVQTSATALLRAKKIDVYQDQRIQKQVELVHESIVAAKRMQQNDPAGASAELTSALKLLDVLKDKTGVNP